MSTVAPDESERRALHGRRTFSAALLAGIALPTALAGASCGAGDANAGDDLSRDGYRLAKDWDFVEQIRDDDALRREFFTRYIYDHGRLDHLNDEWSRYRDDGNHRFTREGLALVAYVAAGFAPGKVNSGMLRSKWSGQYGIFEARLKVPAGRGMWPAFWLNPQDGRWPPEIDVVEIVNNGIDTSRHSFHFVHGGAATQQAVLKSRLGQRDRFDAGVDLALDFHDFAVEWTPDRVRHYLDGRLVIERRYLWRHDDGSDGGPAHVLLNLAVGGQWPGPPTPDVLPARLQVAWIRVWQR